MNRFIEAIQKDDFPTVKSSIRSEFLDKPDTDGNTPLHHAVLSGSYPITRFLLEQGANKTIQNKGGFTPYTLAIELKRTIIMKLFLLF